MLPFRIPSQWCTSVWVPEETYEKMVTRTIKVTFSVIFRNFYKLRKWVRIIFSSSPRSIPPSAFSASDDLHNHISCCPQSSLLLHDRSTILHPTLLSSAHHKAHALFSPGGSVTVWVVNVDITISHDTSLTPPTPTCGTTSPLWLDEWVGLRHVLYESGVLESLKVSLRLAIFSSLLVRSESCICFVLVVGYWKSIVIEWGSN